MWIPGPAQEASKRCMGFPFWPCLEQSVCVACGGGGGGGRWEKGWSTRAVFYRRTRPLSDATGADKGLALYTLLPKGFRRGVSPRILLRVSPL